MLLGIVLILTITGFIYRERQFRKEHRAQVKELTRMRHALAEQKYFLEESFNKALRMATNKDEILMSIKEDTKNVYLEVPTLKIKDYHDLDETERSQLRRIQTLISVVERLDPEWRID